MYIANKSGPKTVSCGPHSTGHCCILHNEYYLINKSVSACLPLDCFVFLFFLAKCKNKRMIRTNKFAHAVNTIFKNFV